MTIFAQIVLAALVGLLVLVIARDIYHTKPESQMDAKRLGTLIGYVLILLLSSALITKFV